MNHIPIKLGPLALLLTVVLICLSVLAILTFTTARADLALAERYAQTVQTRYDLERQAQEFLVTAQPRDSLAFEENGMRLIVSLDDEGRVSRWTLERDWVQSDTIGGLWPGN